MTTSDQRPTFNDLTKALDAQRPANPVMTAQDLPPFDPTNTFMQEAGPHALVTTTHIMSGRDQQGFQVQLLAVTFRSAESTTRYVMPRDYALNVGAQITAAAQSMTTITIADASSLAPTGSAPY